MAVRWICLAVLLTSLTLSATAQEPLELHMPDAPPLTFVSFQGGYGMVGDVALAAIARAGYLSHIHVTPWARAQQRVSRGKNLLIIPLSRTPERETLYSWIAPIMPLERAFFSLDAPVADFAEARQRYRRIAVGHGTAQMEILKSEGFIEAQIVSLKLGDNPARMLELVRVDAWFTGVPEGLYLWPKSNNRLQMSPVLASTDLYLACSKDCDAQLQEDLRKAVAALSAEGMIQRIQETYQPER
ncbi:transporter substrate-binding domain-containing protein [Pseudomonas sp. LjRoot71]|uniref:substrate-binding periplasmic protein n=1 Tax=Pseudomonas sp. LjRoot71 TaxID=3342336 RepID=UPI003ECDF6FB